MEPLPCLVRLEQREDAAAIRDLLEDAFPTTFEAALVDALRRRARPYLGLVAERADRLLGHVLFTPVTCEADPSARLLGLGPIAVASDSQGRGVGTRLGRAGLSAARDTGARAVFVLGDPDFYTRLGFEAASAYDLRCAWEAPDGAFRVLPLADDGLKGIEGLVRYHPAFEGDDAPASGRA